MKMLILLLVPFAFLSAEDKAPARAKAAPAAVAIPADATEIAPHVWRARDKDGKSWIYRQTPFGLSKVEELQAPAAAAAPAAQTVEVKATDLGDSVRFEKATPMGKRVWDRKKSELSAEEQGWLAKNKPAPASAKTAEK